MTETANTEYFRFEPIERVSIGPGKKDVARFYRRTALTSTKARLFTERDIREMLTLAGAFLTASLTPPKMWRRYSKFVSGLRYSRVKRKDFGRFRLGVRAVLGDLPDARIESVFRAYRDHIVRYRLAVIREYVPFCGAPEFRFHGIEALKEAVGRHGGVIVWSNQFSNHTLIGKALAAAGLPAVRVSARTHGFSASAFGTATVNRLVVATENRYLADRLVFERKDGQSVTRRIAGKLAAGNIVLMTNNTYAGSVFVEMPLGESGVVSMATTPLSFAVRRKTPLFLVSIIELEPLSAYAVHFIECPVVSAGGSGERSKLRDHEAMAHLALHARDTMLDHLTAWPEQFSLWPGLSRSYLNGRRGNPKAI